MIAKKFTNLVAMTALILVLAACDGQPAAPTPVEDVPITPTETATAPTNATVGPVMLLTFRLTGGLAGFNTVLVLQESGEYTLTKRGEQPTTGKLEEAELNNIKQQLDAVRGLGGLKLEYDKGNVSDDFYRTVTFDQNGTLKTITVAEQGGKDITPAPLQQLIATVNALVETP